MKISDRRRVEGLSPGSARQNWLCSIFFIMAWKGSWAPPSPLLEHRTSMSGACPCRA